MSPTQSIWYHLGLAYERARLTSAERAAGDEVHPVPKRGSRSSKERRPGARALDADRERALEIPWPDADELLSAAAWLVLDGVIGRSGKSRRPGILRLVWAGVAGGTAALLLDLVRPLLRGDGTLPLFDEDTVGRLVAGAGQGLVYGALVDPRVPGPALLQGALYGSVEYATDELGGLSRLLSAHTPQGRLPGVGDLLAGRDPHDRAFLEHLVFGIALALLYESSPSSSGILPEDEDEE